MRHECRNRNRQPQNGGVQSQRDPPNEGRRFRQAGVRRKPTEDLRETRHRAEQAQERCHPDHHLQQKDPPLHPAHLQTRKGIEPFHIRAAFLVKGNDTTGNRTGIPLQIIQIVRQKSRQQMTRHYPGIAQRQQALNRDRNRHKGTQCEGIKKNSGIGEKIHNF